MTLGKKLIRHWLAITITATALIIGVLSLIQSVGTLGRPFSGFFFGPNLLVSITQRASWPGIERGMKSLDHIVSVDGAKLKDGDQLIERIQHSQPGETLIYRLERKGLGEREIGVPVTRYTFHDFLIGFLAPFLLGLLFLFFGVILYFARPESRGSMLYLIFSCVVGSFCMTVYEAYTTFIFFRVTLMYPMIGALTAHLFAKFPFRRISRPRVRILIQGLYAFSVVLVVWRQWALSQSSTSEMLSRVSSVYVLIAVLVNGFLLVRAYQEANTQSARDRIKVMGIGLLIATSVIALWSLNFILVSEPFYLDEGVLLASAFPFFMSYAILRKNVFALDRVIRLTLSYGVAAATVLALYLIIVGSLRELLPASTVGKYGGWVLVFLAGTGAVLFNLLRRRVNQWVYRFVFRGHYDLSAALSELDRSLGGQVTRVEVAERTIVRISEFLNIERAAILCHANEVNDHLLARVYQWVETPSFDRWTTLFDTEGLSSYIQRKGIPHEITDIEEREPERFHQSLAALKAHRIEAVLPLVSSGKLFGLILLGRKRSKDPYDRADFRLLQPMASRIATVLENTDLATTIGKQERLAALGRMSSIMIHDIKNPLSTIRTAAGSLKRRFREGDHSFELAKIIEEEVDRMNQTIADILTYAKPAGLSISNFSPNDLVNDLSSRMKPVFEEAGVKLEVEIEPTAKLANLDESLVRRALENLLTNAKDATSQGGTVKIRTSYEGAEGAPSKFSIIVEDNGAGMESTIRERVFQPFYTTKAGGTGLGLAVVRQIIGQHGGDIQLETRPGAGTRFTLHFPLQPEYKVDIKTT